MQTLLISRCIMGNERKPRVRKQRDRTIAALNNGTITLRRFHLRRVGFNRVLYDRLLGVTSNQTPAVAGGSAERTDLSDDEDEDEE
jgi:hypothetical protein